MLTLAGAWALWLLPLPLLVHFVLPAFVAPRPSVRLPFLAGIAGHLGLAAQASRTVRRPGLQVLLYVLVWALLVAALARPQWLQPPLVKSLPTRDLLLAVDLSASMEEKDFQDADGARIERLAAVKQVLDDFLARREGDRVALVVFGNAAFVQCPFTTDLDVVQQLLDETAVRMAGPKTAFGDAIGLGVTLFERSALEQRVMIVLTDGNDTGSLVPPAEAARIARDKGIVIHTVAIGDARSVGEEAIDEAALRAVADTTGGAYYFAADTASLEQIYRDLDALETRQVDTVSHRPRVELFHWPLGLAIVLVLLYHAAGALAAARVAARVAARAAGSATRRQPRPQGEGGRG